MTKRNKRKQATHHRKVSAPPEPPQKRRLRRVGLALAGVASVVVAAMALRSTSAKHESSPAYVPRPPGTVAFARTSLRSSSSIARLAIDPDNPRPSAC